MSTQVHMKRTSQRTINTTILWAAGEEENRLILLGGKLFQRSPSGELIFFSELSTRNLHQCHGRYYHKTEEGYYIFDTGAHDGSQGETESEDPEPESRAIKLYYYSGRLFCRTNNVVLTEANNILQEIIG